MSGSASGRSAGPPWTLDTRVVVVGADPNSDPAVDQAAALVRSGELVAFPTETVYGLGADATSPGAVERIFAAKERPGDNPVIVHVAALEQVLDLAVVSERGVVEALAAAFWPGPLTLILPAREVLRRSVCRGLDTAAFRIPAHPVALALIVRAATPIAAPSANLSGSPSPTTARHVFDDLHGRVALILDGGPCAVGIESTVVDLSHGTPCVLRPGQVTRQQLGDVLGIEVGEGLTGEGQPRSPGTRYRHYSPRTPLVMVELAMNDAELRKFLTWTGDRQLRVAYLGSRSVAQEHPAIAVHLRRGPLPTEVARHLYDDLRQLDHRGVDLIVVEGIAGEGFAESIAERMRRAAVGSGHTADELIAVATMLFPSTGGTSPGGTTR